MKKLVVCSFAVFSILFGMVSCTIEDDNPVTCVELQQNLEDLRVSIKDFAATSVCDAEFECRYIAFGEKPCGGPWEYLIYTTSIDTEQLELLVTEFNAQEANYNETCGAVSDCAITPEPTGFTCEDNQCVAIF
ncbi:MAG: hypothetical protein ACPGUH_06065 [Winogradskyella sp.]